MWYYNWYFVSICRSTVSNRLVAPWAGLGVPTRSSSRQGPMYDFCVAGPGIASERFRQVEDSGVGLAARSTGYEDGNRV